jgi:quinol monooxygenase YgiN
MSAIEIVRIPVAAGKLHELGAAVDAARDGYLAEPHCEGADAYGSADGGELIVVVRWASRQAHDDAAASPAGGEFFGAVQALAAGPPTLGWYDPV